MAKKKKKNKWSQRQCEQEFFKLEGKPSEKIVQLSKLSNLSQATLWRYYRNNNWKEKSEEFDSDLRAATAQKVIDRTSDRLADELVRMNEEHIKGLELFRKTAQSCGAIIAAEIQAAESQARSQKIVNKDFSLAVQRYAGIFAQMVQIQRMALGMQYLDLNTAIDQVIKAGYDIHDPSNDV